MVERKDFIDLLFDKLFQVEQIAEETELNTASAKEEVERQIKQAIKGDFITGKGVTKSDEELKGG